MQKRLEVAVCGGSLLAAGIAASLEARGEIRVSRLGSSLAEAAPAVRMLSPQAIIFDIRDGGLAEVGTLLREKPGLVLIGLEHDRDTATVFAAGRQKVESGEELARLIIVRQADEGDR
ncbi:hypothetical protein [Anaeroselena agilis]|uniref:Uncharacterized protein n=1 Tax=Anaeroselena agilis TaxID=3063788 RepID=A0ABU3P4D5_9FIRM|nr:hypothetical protein [Selenomonadales bacterium 4137-cl]